MHNYEFESKKMVWPAWLWIVAGFGASSLGFGIAIAASDALSKGEQPPKVSAAIKSEKSPARVATKKSVSNSKRNTAKPDRSGRIPERKVAWLLAEVGFPAHTIPRMVCTARYESAFDSQATNENSNGTRDSGLFQINAIWHNTCGMTEKQLLDPMLNAECAKKVFDEMGYWAWYGYRKNQDACRRYEVQMGQSLKRDKTSVALR